MAIRAPRWKRLRQRLPNIATSPAKRIPRSYERNQIQLRTAMPLSPRFKELLLQSLEHERGGVLVYQTALECVQNDDLRQEWEKYLAQTREHVTALTAVCTAMGIDPHEMTPGPKIVHHTGTSLVVAMKMALATSDPDAAELVACESV